MSNDVLASAEAYLKAWDNKDIEEIAKYLDPDVHFIGPNADVTGRDMVLQAAKRMFRILRSLKVRSQFASGNQAIFTYDFICADPIGVCRTAELMTFKNGLIAKIELFFDPRPFEKLVPSQDALPKPA